MIRVQEINAFSDNYIWCLFDKNKNAIVIDPGCADSVDDYLDKNELNLCAILVTHHHPDHIGGVKQLKNKHNCAVYGFKGAGFKFLDYELVDKQKFELLGIIFETIEVPGHTLDHIAFYAEIDSSGDNIHIEKQASLFCGDTLFSVGCGRLFEGTAMQMFSSLEKFKKLPLSTLIYCAHEYTLNNLKFAESLMPNNKELKAYKADCKLKRNNNMPTIPSELQTEFKVNPFLRCDDQEIYESLFEAGLIEEYSPLAQFTATRKAKDMF